MTLKERYEGVINYFKTHVPVAQTELHYSNPFELIVAVILSAQCTDKRINQVTPKLFQDFPTPEIMAASNSDTIFNYIKSVSYPNNKAKHLVNMAQMLLKDFNGIVPSEIEDLVKLPGVGRKTANVIASVVYEKPAMAVDTHVFRVSNRIGLTKAKTPLQSEQQLEKHIPEQYIATAHHWLILHGRYTCIARNPKCDICPLTDWCNYFKQNKNIKTLEKKNSVASRASATNSKKAAAKKSSVQKENTTEDKFVAHTTSLKEGLKAPAFEAQDQHGNTISSKDLKGKTIVLFFYPQDNTPTCTVEACNLRDEYKLLSKKNYVVLGVSPDDIKKHQKFATKFELPYSLLADTDMKIIKAYDVWGIKKFMGRIYDGLIRTTFVIDEKGIIKHIIRDVKSKEHAQQILGLN